MLVAAGCALVGIIHSPLTPETIAWPATVMSRLPETARFQSPYHWAAAYGLAALLFVVLALVPGKQGLEEPEQSQLSQR